MTLNMSTTIKSFEQQKIIMQFNAQLLNNNIGKIKWAYG